MTNQTNESKQKHQINRIQTKKETSETAPESRHGAQMEAGAQFDSHFGSPNPLTPVTKINKRNHIFKNSCLHRCSLDCCPEIVVQKCLSKKCCAKLFDQGRQHQKTRQSATSPCNAVHHHVVLREYRKLQLSAVDAEPHPNVVELLRVH